MKTPTLTKAIICACWTVAAFLSAGSISSSFAGPERLPEYGGKEKQIEMVQPEPDPHWYVSIGIGTDFDTDETDFSNGLEIFFPGIEDAPSFLGDIVNQVARSHGEQGGGFAFNGAELTIDQRNWNDAFSNFARISAEFGRRIGDHLELFGRFNYVHADGETVTGSNLTLFLEFDETPFEFVIPFDSKFGDYNSYGGEIGGRWLFLNPQSPVRPYVSLAGGANFVDSIHLQTWTNVLGQPFDIYDDNFYNSSVVGTGAAMLGFESRITRCFSVGVEAGLRYESTLCGADFFENLFGSDSGGMPVANAAAGPNGLISSSSLRDDLNSINRDAGDRLTIPLMFWAKVRF